MKEGWKENVSAVNSQGHEVLSAPLDPQNWLGSENRPGRGYWDGDPEFDRLRHCLFGFCECDANAEYASRFRSEGCT